MHEYKKPASEECSDGTLPTRQENGQGDMHWSAPFKAEDINMVSGAEGAHHTTLQEPLLRPQSPVSQVLVGLQTPAPKFTPVEEAEFRVNALNSRIDVHTKEKALAQSRMNECNASYKLYNAQLSLADQKLFEVTMEAGRAKSALAMARRTPTKSFRFVDLFTDGRHGEIGTAA